MRHVFFIAVLISIANYSAIGQSNPSDLEIAKSYVEKGACDLAVIYYRKIIQTNQSKTVYTHYMQCLIELELHKEAIKLAKSAIKRQPSDPLYRVDLGVVYQRMDEQSKANKSFEDAINSMPPSQPQIISLANRFIQMNELDLAYKTYAKGRRELNGAYSFNYEMATLEGQRGNTEAMIDEYLNLIDFNPAYLNTVQNALGRNFDFTTTNEKTNYLREALMKKVHQQPDNLTYSEMLIWLLVQQKDFYAAFIQAKALDLRFEENGYRVLNIARLSKSNGDFNTAVKCYDYIEKKGKENTYYVFSISERLQVLYQIMLESDDGQKRKEMDQAYRQAIDKLGRNANSANLYRDWAHFKAYYLQQTDTAVVLLDDALAIPGLYSKVEAYLKLELADIYMIQNNIWEASLLYLQVDKAFKNDLIGHEAKFRNARLYYYTGNFNWSKAQLDVLKASTSKLIANDAMELSLLISDNLALDTISLPLEMFARADLLYLQHRDTAALSTLDSIATRYPGHSLLDEIIYKRYEIAFRNSQFEESDAYLQEIVNVYAQDILADKALFKLAELYEYQFEDLEQAAIWYQQLLTQYPNSLYIDEARKRFRRLRGDAIN